MVLGAKNAGATFSGKNGKIPHSATTSFSHYAGLGWMPTLHRVCLILWVSVVVKDSPAASSLVGSNLNPAKFCQRAREGAGRPLCVTRFSGSFLFRPASALLEWGSGIRAREKRPLVIRDRCVTVCVTAWHGDNQWDSLDVNNPQLGGGCWV